LQLGQKPAEAAFNGRLYVLMDEAGFSMNGFILSLLKYHGIGTLVGAPSSGGFRCSDSSMNAVLKETGIRVRYSTAMYEVAVSGMEPGIGVAPDILVVPTLDDYLSGRDAALEAALGAAGL
jgi:C-terminal processing protease CtpA/Prc